MPCHDMFSPMTRHHNWFRRMTTGLSPLRYRYIYQVRESESEGLDSAGMCSKLCVSAAHKARVPFGVLVECDANALSLDSGVAIRLNPSNSVQVTQYKRTIYVRQLQQNEDRACCSVITRRGATPTEAMHRCYFFRQRWSRK